MLRRPPISTRTDTLCPDTTLFRAGLANLLTTNAIEQTSQFNALIPPPGLAVDGNTTQFNANRSDEHTSELQSLMRISSAAFCLNNNSNITHTRPIHEPFLHT